MGDDPESWPAPKITAALLEGDFISGSAKIRPERRGDRVLVLLPNERLAWFPLTAQAVKKLRNESRVLSLVRCRCRFAIPETLFASQDGWVVRSMVAGTVNAYGLAARLKADPLLRLRAAAFLGDTLAQLHGAVQHEDVSDWLPTEPQWPLPRAIIRAKLPRVFQEADLMQRIDHLLTTYDDDMASCAQRTLVHTDLGLHNLAFDDKTGDINGIFDFGSAVWGDRHLDFRYFVFAAIPDALLDEVMSAYRANTGTALSRSRILLCNATGAVSFLADRTGHAADQSVAGRTLDQDLAWTRWALQRAGF